MDETGGQEPVKRETARLADLPVEGLPEDAPEAPYAATDRVPPDLDPEATAHDPGAERGPKAVMTAYAEALEGRRFRHTAQFRRWRHDRDPESCTYEQLERPIEFDLADVLAGRAPG